MVSLRGGTGSMRGAQYGGNGSTHPASTSSKYNTAKSLGSFIPKITKKAYENYGFSTVHLISNWEAIVGPHLAGTTRPEKLKWPKGNHSFYEDDGQKPIGNGATLVLRVDGPNSLEIQFGAGQIIERINTFFGYSAVTDLRIIQAPVERTKPKEPKPMLADPKDLGKKLKDIKDEDLKAALYRMAQGVKAKQALKDAKSAN